MTRSLRNRALCAGLLCLAGLPLLADPPSAPAPAVAGKAEPTPAKETPEGAWRLVEFKSANDEEFNILPPGQEHAKLVTGGRFIWTTTKDGKIIRGAGGRCTIGEGTYIEHIDFVLSPRDQWMVGSTQTFQWEVDDGIWYHTGSLKGRIGQIQTKELWERIKPEKTEAERPAK